MEQAENRREEPTGRSMVGLPVGTYESEPTPGDDGPCLAREGESKSE